VALVELVFMVIHGVLALGVIAGVLLQPGKSAGLSGSIAGGAQTFFGKKKGLDEKIARITSVVAIMFMVTSLVLAVLFGR
jgi:preprotein translocase subunit SecG